MLLFGLGLLISVNELIYLTNQPVDQNNKHWRAADMWTFLALTSLILLFVFWAFATRERLPVVEETDTPDIFANAKALTANANRPEADPSASAITFEVTRGDLCVAHMTAIVQNRALQVLLLLAICLIEWVAIQSVGDGGTIGQMVLAGAVALVGLLVILAVAVFLVTLLIVLPFKHRGVVGQHVLEVTDRGLLERTEFNENLAKWPAIRRIHSTAGYLYIYVSDLQFHVVPKRRLPAQTIATFEAAVRSNAKRSGSAIAPGTKAAVQR